MKVIVKVIVGSYPYILGCPQNSNNLRPYSIAASWEAFQGVCSTNICVAMTFIPATSSLKNSRVSCCIYLRINWFANWFMNWFVDCGFKCRLTKCFLHCGLCRLLESGRWIRTLNTRLFSFKTAILFGTRLPKRSFHFLTMFLPFDFGKASSVSSSTTSINSFYCLLANKDKLQQLPDSRVQFYKMFQGMCTAQCSNVHIWYIRGISEKNNQGPIPYSRGPKMLTSTRTVRTYATCSRNMLCPFNWDTEGYAKWQKTSKERRYSYVSEPNQKNETNSLAVCFGSSCFVALTLVVWLIDSPSMR